MTRGAAVVVARRAAAGALGAAVAADLGTQNETRAGSTPQP
ncbi:MAG TPA: hypothetical protein VFH73_02810 [Polyangia bacterium]|nr:hypothetical protein [Polyangia bacterium]